jgi:integrase
MTIRLRYRSFISLCYREGLSNGKVNINPARLVSMRKEPPGRTGYFNGEQYEQLLGVLTPGRQDAVIMSVNAGMRFKEQYTVEWSQVHFDRRVIRLTQTKNGDDRDVFLNADSMAVLMRLKGNRKNPKGLVFEGGKEVYYGVRKWFMSAVEATGLQDLTWHNNRHTFNPWLAMAGATKES